MTQTAPQDQPPLIIMRPSKRKWIGVALICLTFVALPFVSVADDVVLFISSSNVSIPHGGMSWIDCVVITLFGSGAVIAATQLVPGWNELRLDAEGFCTVRCGLTHRYQWRDIAGDFATCAIHRTTLVTFSLNPGAGRVRWTHNANMALCGQTHGLPDTYGQSAGDLAGLMSTLRHKAMQRPA